MPSWGGGHFFCTYTFLNIKKSAGVASCAFLFYFSRNYKIPL